MQPQRRRVRTSIFVIGAILALGACAFRLIQGMTHVLEIDDAYMFYRYALFVREGHGVVWNIGGPPTYGLTSLAWLITALPFTTLPLPMDKGLVLASWLAGLTAMISLVVVVRSFASSESRTTIAVAAAAYMLIVPDFSKHLVTGMETMLSVLGNIAFVAAVLHLQRRPSVERAIVVGVAGYLTFFVRPENAIFCLLCPVLLFVSDPRIGWKRVATACGITAGLILVHLMLCWLYFATPVPLSFYAKSSQAYVGFMSPENPVTYSISYLPIILPFMFILGLFAKWQNRELWLPYVGSAIVAFAYLATVTQIMGFASRFYIPITPFVVIPALLTCCSGARTSLHRAAASTAALLALALTVSTFGISLQQFYRRASPVAEPATNGVAAPQLTWLEAILSFGDNVVAKLPRGTVVGASEVGYIGAVGPQTNIIDLVGLNDTYVATHGFSMEYLLRKRPDIIWLPHKDYTGMRAEILSDADFRQQYEFHKGAFNYGLAVRKDSPRRNEIDLILRRAYGKLYGKYRGPETKAYSLPAA